MEKDLYKKQRDLLFEVCRKIAIDQKTPNWICSLLREYVMKARKLDVSNTNVVEKKEEVTKDERLEIGDIVKSTIENDNYEYKIIKEYDSIDDVRLFVLKIIKSDNNKHNNLIVHNVSENILIKK